MKGFFSFAGFLLELRKFQYKVPGAENNKRISEWLRLLFTFICLYWKLVWTLTVFSCSSTHQLEQSHVLK